MQKVNYTLVGLAPLMMHNERLANPRDPYTKALKELTSQKPRTEEIQNQMASVEWRAGLYDHNGVVSVPSDNVIAAIKEGARKRKLGKQASAGVFAERRHFPLAYDGPQDIETLAKDDRFIDYRSVGVKGQRIMRCRPRFDEWSLPIELVVDPEVFAVSDLQQALEMAGLVIGLCEKRPQFGRFRIE
jgi:hypothetical protein